jgi:hypothetical protein
VIIISETLKGVPGILRPFKEYLETNGFSKGDQVVFYGVPGTCTPFIELIAFAVRGLGLEQVYVPFLKEKEAKKIINIDGIGMQVSSEPAVLAPKALVIMGGLSMPNIPVKAEDAKTITDLHKGTKIIGICFMNMFEREGWTNVIPFDLMIDATIDPVKVSKKQ